jgi:hypothetical protein
MQHSYLYFVNMPGIINCFTNGWQAKWDILMLSDSWMHMPNIVEYTLFIPAFLCIMPIWHGKYIFKWCEIQTLMTVKLDYFIGNSFNSVPLLIFMCGASQLSLCSCMIFIFCCLMIFSVMRNIHYNIMESMFNSDVRLHQFMLTSRKLKWT